MFAVLLSVLKWFRLVVMSMSGCVVFIIAIVRWVLMRLCMLLRIFMRVVVGSVIWLV